MPDITEICEIAWNRSKKAHQPDYDDLVEVYRDGLSTRAEAIIASGEVSGDEGFEGFENQVKAIGMPEPETVKASKPKRKPRVKKTSVKEAVKKPAKVAKKK